MSKVLVMIPSEKASYNCEFDVANPLQFVGEVLTFPKSQVVEIMGCEVKIPSLTGSNDQKMRTFSTLMQVGKAVFGNMEADEIAPAESEQAQFVDALRAKGFLISHNSKTAVKESIRIWLDGKKAAIKNQELATRQLNVEKLARLILHKKQNATLNTAIKADVQKVLSN
jgi:hypothetical protein